MESGRLLFFVCVIYRKKYMQDGESKQTCGTE